MALNYLPFATVPEIVKASNSAPSLRFGNSGIGVTMLQSGLIDLGYKHLLKQTTLKTGFPDGKYGKETKDAVIQFQKDCKFPPAQIDGIAGKQTINEMDKKLSAKFNAKAPIPTPPKLTPIPSSNKDYMIGTSKPSITPDPGAGVFNSKPTQASMWALKQSILEIIPPRGSSAAVFIGYDAAINMKYYFDASGLDLHINLESMIESGPTATARFKDEVRQAQKFVETLPAGNHQICSKSAESAYNYKSESSNWFYAVGGYCTWGQGKATVSNSTKDTEYILEFEYSFFDRYNWDGGKSVTIGPITITDDFMGEFHRQGLAKEYNMKATIKRKFTWKKGEVIPEVQYKKGSGR